ncbi:hypothetical protein [Cognatishimia maritima]|uniref:Uncharacterized protein n=1 Tax=Cognatishimia maritima TaxID=870908 RepID=A0A1M5NKC8_9RHOB|nr:hypothetical protein [Cognatishimia maritima]SHG89962.1 hypothetical protein SAMN04488044_1566 [Cognatishimia maritima]
MSRYSISKTRLFEGIWDGVVTADEASDDQPHLEATHLEKPLEGMKLVELGEDQWSLRLPIPSDILSDGVQTILIRDVLAQETLEVITIMSGEAIAEDIRAEMDLMRAELDMLKRAFRRHCLETM